MHGNIICDLDGVLYLGEQPVPGAADALRKLQADGFNLIFATNNSSRDAAEVAAKIQRVTGFTATAEQVVTSGQAAAQLLAPNKPVTFVLGGAGISSALADVGIPTTEDWKQATAVVVGITSKLTYRWLSEAVAAVRAGARLVGTNDDATYPTAEGEQPGAGSILAAVEKASGVKAEIAGKPHQPMRELLASRLQPGPIWVVGDRPDTDLALADGAGWKSVLVLSGIVSDEVQPKPDYVIDSIVELPELVGGSF